MTAPWDRKPAAAPKTRKTAAWIFAVVGLAALGFSVHHWRQRYLHDHPPPVEGVIAPIPPEQEAVVRDGMIILAKTILQCTPEQQEQLAKIWEKTPRSVDELIHYQQQTSKILTPEQNARLKPIRQRMQNRIVDQMIAPLGKRLPSEDFEKFREEVKKRVSQRIDGS